MALTKWQRDQYARLLVLLDHAETLADEPKRKLGARLIQITKLVDALVRSPKHGGSHGHVAAMIAELEERHVNVAV